MLTTFAQNKKSILQIMWQKWVFGRLSELYKLKLLPECQTQAMKEAYVYKADCVPDLKRDPEHTHNHQKFSGTFFIQTYPQICIHYQ